MYRAGITGGIGSGKSIVANLFSLMGVPVYNADTSAKRLMQEDPDIKKQIRDLFGNEAYQNGQLNTSFLSSAVFSNPEKLEQLNKIVHPATIKDANDWFEKQNAPYTIKEAALLFESGSSKDLDFIIGVSAPSALRIKRVMDRNKITAEEVKKRMKNQIDEPIKMRLCDHVIQNDDLHLVIPQVLRLHQQLLERADQKNTQE
jgi:dephospho-CoA kinase